MRYTQDSPLHKSASMAKHSSLKNAIHYIFAIAFLLMLNACGEPKAEDLTDVDYAPVEYNIGQTPKDYPTLEVPEDNPMTVAGVDLGRHLFYDPILSRDGTMACAGCHFQESGFTDNLATSKGIDNIAGHRSAMSLVDIGYALNGLFWDGRSQSLEEQALLPVEDPIELHHLWPDVIEDLKAHDEYKTKFRQAFGITTVAEIDKDLVVKAIAQFERSLISSNKSIYDKVLAGRDIFDDDAFLGQQIFFDLDPEKPDGQCFHCHAAPLFTDNEYRNNGLDAAESFDDFVDLGRGGAIGVREKNGMFRTPTLRNIEFTAPYMHDGRFETLEEVMDHYISGGHLSPNTDALIDSIKLNSEEKAAVIAFLKTLSDPDFLNDERFSDPNE